MTHIELFVREINPNSENITASIDFNEINLSPKRLPPNSLSTGDSNELSIDSPVKKRRMIGGDEDEEDGEEDEQDESKIEKFSPQSNKNHLLHQDPNHIDIEDGEEEEDDDGDEEFLKQLELLQNQDISSLQQLIVSMEKSISS